MTAMHDEFRGMGLSGVSGFLGAVVVDVRGMFDVGVVEGMGFSIERYDFQKG